MLLNKVIKTKSDWTKSVTARSKIYRNLEIGNSLKLSGACLNELNISY